MKRSRSSFMAGLGLGDEEEPSGYSDVVIMKLDWCCGI
jgi:hypothetical protein